MINEFKKLLNVLEWYGDGDNYNQAKVPGETTLFGYEADEGKRAIAALKDGKILLSRLERVEKELAAIRAEQKGQIKLMDFRNIHIDLWMHTFVCANSVPLLAQAYQGYSLKQGLGAVFIGVFWLPDQDGLLTYQVKSNYLSCNDIAAQVPEPYLAELDRAVQHYDPLGQAVLVFYGNDLSSDRNNRFSTEKNFFKIQVIGDGISAIESAENLGVSPPSLSYPSVPSVSVDHENL